MINQPYQAEIETVILHTLAALGDVRIKRYVRANGRETGIEKKIDVPITYSPKSRTLGELIEVNGQHSFPFMSLRLTGVARDPERINNKDGSYTVQSVTPEGTYKNIHSPVPVKLNMTLDVTTVFEEDMLQILNNFIAYFNPYISISWKEPFTGQELITKVKWDGSSTYESVRPLQSGDKERFNSSLALTVESFIFREEKPDGVPIRCFDMSWYALSSTDLFALPVPSSALVGEVYTCADPCVNGLYPTCLSAGDAVTIYGQNFDNIDAVFLLGPSSVIPNLTSASSIDWCKDPDPIPTDNYYDLYQYNQQLSANNPAFYGLSIDDYRIISENAISVTMPDNLGVGRLDIRLASLQAGYTDITDAEKQAGCILSWVPGGLLVGTDPPPPVTAYGFSLGFSLGFSS